MCFPKSQPEGEELSPLFLEDGSLNVDESYIQAVIPESVHQHIDSVYLNFDVDEGILAFVYESGYEIIIVYTSPEAEEFCEGLKICEEDEKENPFLE